jgi:hypothetical protein
MVTGPGKFQIPEKEKGITPICKNKFPAREVGFLKSKAGKHISLKGNTALWLVFRKEERSDH